MIKGNPRPEPFWYNYEMFEKEPRRGPQNSRIEANLHFQRYSFHYHRRIWRNWIWAHEHLALFRLARRLGKVRGLQRWSNRHWHHRIDQAEKIHSNCSRREG